jgi:hypothetical protein
MVEHVSMWVYGMAGIQSNMWKVLREEVNFSQPIFWIRIIPDYSISRIVPTEIRIIPDYSTSRIVPDYAFGGQVEKVMGDWRCLVLG